MISGGSKVIATHLTEELQQQLAESRSQIQMLHAKHSQERMQLESQLQQYDKVRHDHEKRKGVGFHLKKVYDAKLQLVHAELQQAKEQHKDALERAGTFERDALRSKQELHRRENLVGRNQ